MRCLPVVALCLLAWTLVPGAAVAQPGKKGQSQTEKERAAEYFRSAEELLKTGEFVRAAETFILAYEQVPHPSVLANIALSFDRAGRTAEAVKWYRRYLEGSTGGSDDPKIRHRLSQLEESVVELHLTCAFQDCDVRVDGVDEGRAPLTVVVEPGAHTVAAMDHGDTVAVIRVSAVAGAPVTMEIGGTSTSFDEPGPSSSEPEKTRVKLRWPTWVSLGTTAVGGVLAIAFGAATVSAKSEFDDTGQNDTKLKQTGESLRGAANAMVVITCVAAVASTVFIILDVRAHRRDQEQLRLKMNAAIAPLPGGLSAGLTLQF